MSATNILTLNHISRGIRIRRIDYVDVDVAFTPI